MLQGSAPEGSKGLVNVVFCGLHEIKTETMKKTVSDEKHFMLLKLLTGRFYYSRSGGHGFSKIRCAIGIPCKFLDSWIPGIFTSLS